MRRRTSPLFPFVLLASLLTVCGLVFFLSTLNQSERARAAFPGYNGRIIWTRTTTSGSNIWSMLSDGTVQVQLTSNGQSNDPSWSPNGTKIAFVRQGDIWVMNANGTGQTKLTDTQAPSLEANPAWSPDGTKILYTLAFGSYNSVIWVMNADGSGQAALTPEEAFNAYPAWSPDGTKIAYQTDLDGNMEIFTMNPDGSNPLNLTNDSAFDSDPDWAPDGSRIVFVSRQRGDPFNNTKADLFVMNSDGTGLFRLTNNGNAYDNQRPAWSSEGDRVAFSSTRMGSQNSEIFAINIDGTGEANLSNFSSGNDSEPSWQPSTVVVPTSTATETLTPTVTYTPTETHHHYSNPHGDGDPNSNAYPVRNEHTYPNIDRDARTYCHGDFYTNPH